MSTEPYPNDADLADLRQAHDLLTAAGVTLGPNGFDVNTLAAAAYDHGLAYRIDRAAGLSGYQVELRPQMMAARQSSITAVGWEPEVALAFGLAQALTQRAQRANAPRGGHQTPAGNVSAE